ncbi:GNAT family N-acetyltransferase [Streptomyces cinereoruber]|uniref:GNAT family N-acetyltransferase n=1 Tax=Streptomyces cinereoruber TaxID=67260 RepID=UPI003C2AF0C4
MKRFPGTRPPSPPCTCCPGGPPTATCSPARTRRAWTWRSAPPSGTPASRPRSGPPCCSRHDPAGTGGPVAFSCFHPWPGEGFEPAPTAESAALYALPEVRGAGVGRALLSATTGALVEAGFRSAALWVFAGNARARRFYEAAGRRADGESVREETGGRVLEELRYRRDLLE